MRETPNESGPETDWKQIGPVLDDVMHQLKAGDREAIVLRYFENRPFAEVGAKLGLNENAARMRVERALDKLRALLVKRGISTTAALASIIAANAVQLAPGSLAATLTTTSISAAETGLTFTLLKIMTATKLKIGLGALVAVGATTVLVVQHQTQEKLRAENESLQQQVAQLKTDNDSLSNRPAPVADVKSLPDEQFKELLRLRGEVGVLRQQTNELKNLLANGRNVQPRHPNPVAEQQQGSALPEDYPRTPDGATTNIFNLWARGDWEAFLTNFGQPGVPREFYDRMFTDQMKSNLAGMQIVSVGQPTNGFGPNHYFVPYKVQFQDGTEKEFRLSVKQDPRSQRWYFDGGF